MNKLDKRVLMLAILLFTLLFLMFPIKLKNFKAYENKEIFNNVSQQNNQKAYNLVHVSELTTEQMFALYGKKYGIPTDLLIAISKHETANFTSKKCRNLNNYGGNFDGVKFLSFKNKAEGIEYMISNLANNKAYKHVNWQGSINTILNQLQPVYAPIGHNIDTNDLNKHWKSGVMKYYENKTI